MNINNPTRMFIPVLKNTTGNAGRQRHPTVTAVPLDLLDRFDSDKLHHNRKYNSSKDNQCQPTTSQYH